MIEALVLQTLLFWALLWLVGTALQEGGWSGQPSPELARLVHWTPRAAIVAGAGLASVLAADELGSRAAPRELVAALAADLVPALVLLVAAAVAWRWPLVGSALLAGWSGWYLAVSWDRLDAGSAADLAGIPFLMAVLFLLDWRYHAVHPDGPDDGGGHRAGRPDRGAGRRGRQAG
jgi:hypothetical protein